MPSAHLRPCESSQRTCSNCTSFTQDEEEEVRAKMEVLLDKGLVDWTRVMPITPVRQVRIALPKQAS